MTYRDDLEALSARKAALDAELAAKTRERDDAARLLADAQARSRLPVLPNIRIASPCKAPWEEMKGDDRVRHCAKCDKDVFNLSAMTREQAESLIVEKQGKLCARYFQRQDGTILLADCEVGRKHRRRVRMVTAGMAVTITAVSATVAVRVHQAERPHELAGAVLPIAESGEVELSTGMPACDDYRAAIRELEACDAMPAQARDAVWIAYEQAAASWESVPESGRAALSAACKESATAIREAAEKLCGSHPQSPANHDASQRGNAND
jgi:hypothetical protein